MDNEHLVDALDNNHLDHDNNNQSGYKCPPGGKPTFRLSREEREAHLPSRVRRLLRINNRTRQIELRFWQFEVGV